jgi:hypothetical protein
MKRSKASIIASAVVIPLTIAGPAMASTPADLAQDNLLSKPTSSIETSRTGSRSTRRRSTGGTSFINAPRIVGTIVSIYGSTVQIIAQNSVTYTTDTSRALIRKGFGTNTAPLSVTDLKTGDLVAVVGDPTTPKGVTSFAADRLTLLR